MQTYLLFLFAFLSGTAGVCHAVDIYYVSSLKPSVSRNLQALLENATFHKEKNTVSFHLLDEFVESFSDQLTHDSHNLQLVVALGSTSCETIARLENTSNIPIICTAITRNQYGSVDKDIAESYSHIVYVDQPVDRQATVAHSLYPSLSRFGVIATEQFHLQSAQVESSKRFASEEVVVVPFIYDVNMRLLPQIRDTGMAVDALIAVADREVYNSNNFSTILLTSYGLGIPLIGYSASIQKSGALISIYSSLEQVVYTVSEIIDSYARKDQESGFDIGNPPTRHVYPKYYHVEINSSVGASLDLRVYSDVDRDRWYTDSDFFP